MNHLIERYTYDVTRRLPEKDREEVAKELKSNIYDMLSEQADEEEIKAVLYELGAPALLAEKYRSKPRYLISPALYDTYIYALKWVLPLVGVVVMGIGMIMGAFDVIKRGMTELSQIISNTLTMGFQMGISAAFQALVWTTFGFAITERINKKDLDPLKREWKIEDLPEEIPQKKGRIPLSDSIAELILTVLFSATALCVCYGLIPTFLTLERGEIQVISLFSPEFLALCIPAIIAMGVLSLLEAGFKIKYQRWTPLVCAVVVVSNIISMGILLYLLNRPDLFSSELITFVQGVDWGSLDVLRFMGKGGINPIIAFVSIVIVVCSLGECFGAVYKTLKSKS